MDHSHLNSTARILVVGTSGAGKTTLARKLAQKLALTDIELDALYWEENWTPTTDEVFRRRIQTATNENPGWVLHGGYNKVHDLTWGKATTLIWLDYSQAIVLWRVFKRSVLRILNQEPLWAGNRESFRQTFFSKDSIILWSIQTYKQRKEQYTAFIQSPEYSHLTVLRFQTPKQTEIFLKQL